MQLNSKTIPLSTKSNALWNATGCFFYLGCQWLTTIFVVLFSTDFENSGILAFAMSTGNMFSAIGLYKIRTYQVSDIKSVFSPNNYVGFRFATIGVGAAATIFYLLLSTGMSTFTFASIAYLLFKADETLNDVFFGIEQKSNRMDYIGKSQFLRGIATILGFTVPLILFDSLILAVLGMALMCMSITLIYDCRNAMMFGFTRPSISRTQIKQLALACLMPTIANFLATSIVSVARQKYGLLYGESMLGVYASIATPAVLVQAAASYLYSPLIGKLALTLSNGGIQAFRQGLIKTIGIMLAAICAMCIAVSGAGIWGLPILFGESIASYVWTFPYVLISTGCVALLYFVNDMLIIIRKGTAQLIINALALAVTIVCLDPFTEAASMNGVNMAIITGCLLAIIAGLAYIFGNKKL